MADTAKTLYHCGTLTYTKFGLLNLAIWLLWGDFSFILLSNVFPALTPLQLNLHNASNATIGLLMGSVPAVITTCTNDRIQDKSEHRKNTTH